MDKDPFRPQEKNEELLDFEVSYLTVIGTLKYLANYTWPDLTFSINLFTRFSFSPTQIY